MDALSAATSGIRAHTRLLDAAAHNLANVSTVRGCDEEGFRSATPVPASSAAGGVEVSGVALGEPGPLASMPEHPLADSNGLVRLPGVDVGREMLTAQLAAAGVAANVAVARAAQDAYRSMLELGSA